MYLIITLIVSAFTALYVYLVWNFSYWKKRNVPGPDPLPILGNMSSFLLRNQPILEELDKIYKKYKTKFNFVGIFNVRTPRILITSPALAKNILTMDFKSFHDNEFGQMTDKELDPLLARNPFMLNGEEWKTKRAEITPAFTTSRMKAMFPLVEDVASRMTKYIKSHEDSPLEAKELAAKFTTDVVSSCIFDTDAQSFTTEKPEIREMGRKLLDFGFTFVLVMICRTMLPKLSKILQLGIVPKSAENFFINLMKEAVRYRDGNSVSRVDYLEHLISLRNKKEITELEIAAHGVTFFLDGFETSSVAISFTLYELAKNPDVQERLRVELVEAANKNGSISYDVLLELPYLDQVINEALRLWPPVGLISKLCTEPIDLNLSPSQNIHIDSGVYAMINSWSFHRDPEYYEDPLTFDPNRFSPETGGINPYREKGCYLPFGDGPRQCLGMRFARMQVKRAICEVVSNFVITVDSKTKEPMRLDPAQFLITALGGIWLRFEPTEK
ncbi:probable cytochrome P450 28a5 [Topomyia yanbarensis]|uniref:probable cytochrome P450 28a5 n=1 Tax=Topomyia yanbarensis TaxID=2498891 RepID=UPI00273C3CE1|nr:probable cytochrome P450 28a5 [Topomyia yanbarensis]